VKAEFKRPGGGTRSILSVCSLIFSFGEVEGCRVGRRWDVGLVRLDGYDLSLKFRDNMYVVPIPSILRTEIIRRRIFSSVRSNFIVGAITFLDLSCGRILSSKRLLLAASGSIFYPFWRLLDESLERLRLGEDEEITCRILYLLLTGVRDFERIRFLLGLERRDLILYLSGLYRLGLIDRNVRLTSLGLQKVRCEMRR